MKKFCSFLFSFVPFLIGYGFQYVIAIYFMILSAVFMLLFAPSITGSATSYDDMMTLWMDMDFNSIIMIVFSISCSTFFGIWYYKSCSGNLRPNIKQTFHPLQLLGTIIMVPATQFATSFLISILSTIFPKWLEEYQAMMESAGMGTEVTALMMIYSVCLAPFSEEFIFRGVTMRLARRALPFWAANIFQAVLFGVFHGNWLQGCYAFALGLILGYVCERGGSIYHAILFHFLFNLMGTTSQWMNLLDQTVLGILVLAGTFLILPAGFLIFHIGVTKKKQSIQLP